MVNWRMGRWSLLVVDCVEKRGRGQVLEVGFGFGFGFLVF